RCSAERLHLKVGHSGAPETSIGGSVLETVRPVPERRISQRLEPEEQASRLSLLEQRCRRRCLCHPREFVLRTPFGEIWRDMPPDEERKLAEARAIQERHDPIADSTFVRRNDGY